MTVEFARPARAPLAACLLFLLPALLAPGCGRRSARDYIKSGDQALHDNQLGTAQEDYEAAVKLAPDDPQAHIKLGDFYSYEHNYPAAEAEYVKAINLKPLDASTHAALASLYSKRGQWSQAENQMRAAVVLNPASPEYRRQLAAVLNQRKQAGQAEIELRTAVGLAPADAKLHLALANFLATLPNERGAADEEFARVRQLDPSLLPPAEAAVTPPPAPEGPPPAEVPPPAAPPVASAVPAAPKPVRPLNKKFLLTHNSPVYQSPDANSAVVAQVHRHKYVHVTGISGNWLQVTLRNGTVGFIPASAAE
jgi:tetratricopeptide (TPR) repeat protein